jgi:tight adherence protein B
VTPVTSDQAGLLVLAGTLVVATAGAWDLLAAGATRDELRERATGERAQLRSVRLGLRLNAAFERTPPGRRLQLRLDGASVPLRALQAALIALAAGIGGYLAASLIVGHTASVVAGALVVVGLSMWLERKREQRRDAFLGQLPDLARILSNGASAGLSMVSAYGIAVKELDEPARTELQIALAEIRIGQPFERAMENLGERLPSRELSVLVSTLAIQQRSGGDLVRALSDMAATLEARRETQREVKTLMAGATASSYVVMVIGAGALFLADLTRPGTLDRVASSPLGLVALGVSLILFVTGFLLIKRITRIET